MSIKKIVTCGSVDDGKSTLIGRIIFETQNIFNDQQIKLKKLSSRYGTTGSKLDYALLLDGLQDEREQGITIDVAHRYIETEFMPLYIWITHTCSEKYSL